MKVGDSKLPPTAPLSREVGGSPPKETSKGFSKVLEKKKAPPEKGEVLETTDEQVTSDDAAAVGRDEPLIESPPRGDVIVPGRGQALPAKGRAFGKEERKLTQATATEVKDKPLTKPKRPEVSKGTEKPSSVGKKEIGPPKKGAAEKDMKITSVEGLPPRPNESVAKEKPKKFSDPRAKEETTVAESERLQEVRKSKRDFREVSASAETLLNMPAPSQPPFPVQQVVEAPRSGAEPARLIESLVQEVLVGVNASGHDEVQIQLNSKTLEGTRIHISKEEGGVSIKFLTSSDEVSRLLNSNLDTLSQALAARELRVTSVQVQTGPEPPPLSEQGGRQGGGSRQGGGQERQQKRQR